MPYMNQRGARHWRDAAAVLLMALGVSVHAAPLEKELQEVRKLNEQALGLFDQGQYQKAAPVALQAVAVSEKKLGPQHPATAKSLDILGRIYRATSDYAQAKR
jgi:hypothetical protein